MTACRTFACLLRGSAVWNASRTCSEGDATGDKVDGGGEGKVAGMFLCCERHPTSVAAMPSEIIFSQAFKRTRPPSAPHG
jgi:hypothetical protein